MLTSLAILLITCHRPAAATEQAFETHILPVLEKYCIRCHSTESREGELDLQQFESFASATNSPQIWESVLAQIEDQEMPPADEPQLPADLKAQFTQAIDDMLRDIAFANAGDPGRVVLRRLSNKEYTYTIRDITGIPTLEPAKEFPVDGAAGEGFTNVGDALVMSPGLLTKYLDAAKEISGHAVLVPDGITFSEFTSRRDWTNETLAKIRQFYARYSETLNEAVEVGGTGLVRNDGGRIPLSAYLTALSQCREDLSNRNRTLHAVAGEHELNEKYLNLLWEMLNDDKQSLVLDVLRAKWQTGQLTTHDIKQWQNSLWRFANVGHLGKTGGPTAWMEPVVPLLEQQEFRVRLQAPADGSDVALFLATGAAGDGNEHDYALWEKARIVRQGKPDISVKDLPAIVEQLQQRRSFIKRTARQCLAAAHTVQQSDGPTTVADLARKHHVDAELLQAWLNFLDITGSTEVAIGELLTGRLESASNYDFIKGWVGADAFSVVSNSSDATVQIPGTMKPHSVATHPSPQLASIIGWRSPITGAVSVAGSIQDAHTDCGNGVTWGLEIRRGSTRQLRATGTSSGSDVISIGTHKGIQVQQGDMITLRIGPGDGNHFCDLTAVELSIGSDSLKWDLAKDVAQDILAGNPHADRFGNDEVWYFFGEPEASPDHSAIPPASLLGKWLQTPDEHERAKLASEIEQLLRQPADALPQDSPDRIVRDQLLSFNGPLLASVLEGKPLTSIENENPPYGLPPSAFGSHPYAGEIAETSLCVQAPNLTKILLPAELVDDAEFVVEARLHPAAGSEGSVQLQVVQHEPPDLALRPSLHHSATPNGAWTSSMPSMAFDAPLLVRNGSQARERFEMAFAAFRELFPAALCYTTIVPVDEVVTLTLFHREDEPLVRLMLSDTEREELDRLWDQLHFVSEDALTLVEAYEQIWQFSTQDGPDAPHGDKRLEPLREPILRAAEQFKQHQIELEPLHLDAVLGFASTAWRRPLKQAEQDSLRLLYEDLRLDDIAHEEAIRLLIARVLVSPAFLYRGEQPGPGSASTPVNSWELASRLSFFLWSSVPDAKLRAHAQTGDLRDPAVLIAEVHRMLGDDRVRRLATEFGCQWLHVRDVTTLNEKSERHFPSFLALREDMQEEATQYFTHLFQENQSLLNLLDADHTYMNESLAKHYDVPFEGSGWQRVEGMRARGRGGVLGFAATLSKQSGASRTSPILRGNWVSEVLLGDRLPRPPKDVPVLPDETPEGLTERELIERHSSDPACARCHDRIDPYGFALEAYDAIGRFRTRDAAGLPIQTDTQLPDGVELSGFDGLRLYLVENRREDFLRQFCRKLLGYALGRSVQLSDKPLIDEMLVELERNDCRISTVIEMIVVSSQFRNVRGREYPAGGDVHVRDKPPSREP